MIFQKIPIDKLLPNPKNPRIALKEGMPEYKKLRNSIEHYDYIDPIIWNKRTGYIIAGHQRLQVMKDIARDKGEALTEVQCVVVDMSESDQDSFMIAHNKISGDWDYESLQALVDSFDEDVRALTGFDADELIESASSTQGTDDLPMTHLSDDFLFPPFSVLDTRSGVWQSRKRKWLTKTGNLSLTRDGEFGRGFGQFRGNSGILYQINDGTSNFDPVFAELMYKWFNLPNGKILDPFGGEQTKGVVAGELGYTYHAVEIRSEQVDLNKEQTKAYPNVHYYCGDSNDISKIIKERGFNLLFTSPPYYDLEVYSKEDMSALGTYEEFMQMYRNIFQQCYDMLADGSFAVIKVGEIRDKDTGIYRSFVPDNVKVFTDIGFHYYNEIIILNACGTAPMRARKSMDSRKITKIHQNVLVFYKGDVSKINKLYPKIEVDYEFDEDACVPPQDDSQ